MRARILCIFLLLFLGLGAIASKLYAVQVRQRDRLSERASRQYQRLVPVLSHRGTIYDRSGREFAVSLRVASAFAQPASVQDAGATARALAPVLRLPVAELRARLASDKTF